MRIEGIKPSRLLHHRGLVHGKVNMADKNTVPGLYALLHFQRCSHNPQIPKLPPNSESKESTCLRWSSFGVGSRTMIIVRLSLHSCYL